MHAHVSIKTNNNNNNKNSKERRKKKAGLQIRALEQNQLAADSLMSTQ